MHSENVCAIAFIYLCFYVYQRNYFIYYYKCKVNKNYYSSKSYLPLCYYDIKFKSITFYGYINYTNVGDYKYKSQNIAVSKYNSKFYNTAVNITIQKRLLRRRKISLCIVSIFKNLNTKNIIRTCLIYKELGVEHITLYVSYYDDKYKYYYKWLRKQSWIDIIYFELPKIRIFYYAQDAKLNHCINHYRYISKYVIITDVYEIIIPAEKNSIYEIIKKYNKNNFVFSFKSVLFEVNTTQSSVFSANKVGCKIEQGYEKMIIRPEKIKSIGAHFPKEWQEKGKIVYVNIKDGYVIHARVKSKSFVSLKCNFTHHCFYLEYLINKIEKFVNNKIPFKN